MKLILLSVTLVMFLQNAGECISHPPCKSALRVPMVSGSKENQRLRDGSTQMKGAIEYVSSPELLNLSENAEIKKAWDATVMHHLVLYEFAREFSRLTREKGLICNFGEEDLRKLSSYVDFRKQRGKDLIYNIGFIAWNSKIINNPQQQVLLFRFNLLMFAAMQRADFALELLLNEKNREVVTAFSQDTLFEQLLMNFITSYAHDKDYAKVDNIWENSRSIFLESLDLNSKRTQILFREIFFLLLRVFPESKLQFESMAGLKEVSDHAVLLSEYESVFNGKIFDYLRKAKPVFRHDIAGQQRTYKTIDIGLPFFQGPSLFGEARGKILSFTLSNGQEFYIKRINPLRVNSPEEEIIMSQRAEKALQDQYPRYHAQKFVGIIHYKEALYLVSLGIKGMVTMREDDIQNIQRILAEADIPNSSGAQREKELIEDQDGNIYVLDFETFPYHGEEAVARINKAVRSHL